LWQAMCAQWAKNCVTVSEAEAIMNAVKVAIAD